MHRNDLIYKCKRRWQIYRAIIFQKETEEEIVVFPDNISHATVQHNSNRQII